MSKDEPIMAFAGGGKKPSLKTKFEKNGPKALPRDVKDMTCPNCYEKRHKGQDCTKPKIDPKLRKFVHLRRGWLHGTVMPEAKGDGQVSSRRRRTEASLVRLCSVVVPRACASSQESWEVAVLESR